jgi:DNA-binding transcriptional LysR family regulator
VFQWDDLKFFLATIRARSASQAAAALGVSTTTVTRRLAALEEQLGAVLFARTPEGLTPTLEAAALVASAEAMERAAAEVELAVDTAQVEPAGLVRVTCVPDVAQVVLIPALPGLMARYPKLRLSLSSSTELADLGRREADLALRTLRPDSGELISRRLRSVSYGIFGIPELLAPFEGGVTRSNATRVRWVGLETKHAWVPEARWMAEALPMVEPAITGSSLTEVRLLAMAGAGVALLPRVLAELVPKLREIPWRGEAPPIEGGLWIVGHAAGQQTPRIRAVWDFLVELCSEAAPEGPQMDERRSQYNAAYGADGG